MGKSRKQETEQTSKREVDPELVADYEGMTDAARMLTGLRSDPQRTETIAAFTPMHETGLETANLAAEAFGMPVADLGIVAPTKNKMGIRGYDTSPLFDEAKGKIPKKNQKLVEELLALLGTDQTASPEVPEPETKGPLTDHQQLLRLYGVA